MTEERDEAVIGLLAKGLSQKQIRDELRVGLHVVSRVVNSLRNGYPGESVTTKQLARNYLHTKIKNGC